MFIAVILLLEPILANSSAARYHARELGVVQVYIGDVAIDVGFAFRLVRTPWSLTVEESFILSEMRRCVRTARGQCKD